jgi:hypothetical protein
LVLSDWPLLSSAASFDTSSLSVRAAKESMASKNHTMKQTVQTFMDETSTMPLQRIKHLPSQRTLSSQRKSWRKTRNVIHLCIHSKSSVSLLLIALVLVGSLTFTDAQSPAPVPTAAEATDAPIADSPATDAPVSGPETLAPSTAEPDAMEPPVSATPETQAPTVTPRPSGSILTYIPTVTLLPSGAPSFVPTALPTFRESIIAEARFRQKFLVGNGRIFNDNEIAIFETLYQGYTKSFAQNDDTKIMTTCVVDAQEGLDERRLLRKRNGFAGNGGMPWKSRPERRTQGDEIIEAVNMDYTMTYTSSHFNVSSYPILFQNWINVNLVTVTEQMRLLQLNVSEAQTASRLIIRTPAPTVSLAPSAAPTGRPTITPYPSYAPSNQPTTVATRTQPSRNDGVIIIVVSLVIGLSIVGIGLLIYFRKKRRKREIDAQTEKNKNGQGLEGPPGGGGWNGSAQGMHDAEYDGMESPENNYGSAFRKYADPSANQSAVLSPSESRASNQSLLSAGNSMGEDSADEADTTQIFADEFDQYKDQNLEKMRADIEGNLEGCDGMMNQAVARALIDEDDLNFGATDYLWGGDANVTGQEIEASALGDVMDWLKRNEKASVEEKYVFFPIYYQVRCRYLRFERILTPFPRLSSCQARIYARNTESHGRQCATRCSGTQRCVEGNTRVCCFARTTVGCRHTCYDSCDIRLEEEGGCRRH